MGGRWVGAHMAIFHSYNTSSTNKTTNNNTNNKEPLAI